MDVEPAHQLVDRQRAGSEDLREPALRRAPQHGHLPQPVLGMCKAEAEERVLVGFGEDVRNVRAVADDLDGSGDARNRKCLRAVRNRAQEEQVDARRNRQRERQQEESESCEQAKESGHECLVPPLRPKMRHARIAPERAGSNGKLRVHGKLDRLGIAFYGPRG